MKNQQRASHSKKPHEIAFVRSSPKSGYFRVVYVWEKRSDGWIRGSFQREEPRDFEGIWVSPVNVISIQQAHASWDYNGIEPGTLVNFGSEVCIVMDRTGARYRIVDVQSGKETMASWEYVVPLEADVVEQAQETC